MDTDANTMPDSSSDDFSDEYAEGTLEADEFESRDADEGGSEPSDPAEHNTDEGEPGKEEPKDTPFHEHPRWKQVMESRRADRTKIADLEARLKEAPKVAPKVAGLFDGMTQDQLLEQLDSDPIGILQKVAQFSSGNAVEAFKAEKARAQQRSSQASIMQKVEEYFEDPEAKAALDSGELEAYMKEHPGNSPMGAHRAMTEEARFDARLKTEKAKWLKEVKAKGKVGYIPASTGKRGAKSSSDNSGDGDVISDLQQTLAAMRS